MEVRLTCVSETPQRRVPNALRITWALTHSLTKLRRCKRKAQTIGPLITQHIEHPVPGGQVSVCIRSISIEWTLERRSLNLVLVHEVYLKCRSSNMLTPHESIS